ncbi:MAG: DUF4296 domain-containing protein [Prevotellaceae bacterium]|jgi:hypothetical protein|nr:DUF4296 domain-containing protein [Prevotellaceae bacterium]
MKNKIFYIIIALVLFSCSMQPFGVMNSEKMEDVLYDFYIADATISTKRLSSERNEYYNYVFEKHKISKNKFEKSIKWYAAKPQRLELIYSNVKNRIEKLQADVDSYKFHPEEKLTDEKNSLDTIAIYKFEQKYYFDDNVPKDSLKFEIADRNYFALGDRFILQFFMKIESLDAKDEYLPTTKASLIITYSDGKQKRISQKLFADNKTYKYTFQPVKNDSLAPTKIEINLFDGNDMLRSFTADSVKFLRIFNYKKYPLSDHIKTAIDTIKTKLQLPAFETDNPARADRRLRVLRRDETQTVNKE